MAVVVAGTPYGAYDALYLIDVEYEALPAVVDPQRAAADGASLVHDSFPGNQAFHWVVSGGDIDAAFASAEVVVEDRIVQQRLSPRRWRRARTPRERRELPAHLQPASEEERLAWRRQRGAALAAEPLWGPFFERTWRSTMRELDRLESLTPAQ